MTSNKLVRTAVKAPKQITAYIEKTKDQVKQIDVADMIDVACGTNHTVSGHFNESYFYFDHKYYSIKYFIFIIDT